jgi:glutathione S-transferase
LLKLFYAQHTCALASHIALEEAAAPYEAVRLDFAAAQQQSAGYLAVNPKARVPALVVEQGVITETPAILAYVAQRWPAARLAPLDDPFAFARVQEFNSYLCSTVHVAHAHRVRGYRWADSPAALEDMKNKVPQTVGDCFALIERQFVGPWVMGEAYTICDPYLFTVARWLEGDSIDPARFPRVLDHRNRMEQRPATQRALKIQFG